MLFFLAFYSFPLFSFFHFHVLFPGFLRFVLLFSRSPSLSLSLSLSLSRVNFLKNLRFFRPFILLCFFLFPFNSYLPDFLFVLFLFIFLFVLFPSFFHPSILLFSVLFSFNFLLTLLRSCANLIKFLAPCSVQILSNFVRSARWFVFPTRQEFHFMVI